MLICKCSDHGGTWLDGIGLDLFEQVSLSQINGAKIVEYRANQLIMND
jgi:hypothetical protein